MAKSTELSNAILDAILSDGIAGQVPIGGLILTLPFSCLFLSTVSTADVQGNEWPTNAGYPSGGVSLAGLFEVDAFNGIKTNSSAIIVTNAPATTWAQNEIVDTSAPFQVANRLIFGPATSLNKTINAGDTCIIPIGALVGRES